VSGADKGRGGERRSMLGEFSAAHKREFEIKYERDFDQTVESQMEIEAERQFEENNLKQRKVAELDSIGHSNENVPSYGLSHDSETSNIDRYNEIMERHQEGLELLDAKYTDIRDDIRGNGETLSDDFGAQVEVPVWEPETTAVDFEQLGIDMSFEYNSVTDANYHGNSVGYDYNEHANPFSDDYSSHYEGDFTIDDDGNDTGNDGNDEGRSM